MPGSVTITAVVPQGPPTICSETTLCGETTLVEDGPALETVTTGSLTSSAAASGSLTITPV